MFSKNAFGFSLLTEHRELDRFLNAAIMVLDGDSHSDSNNDNRAISYSLRLLREDIEYHRSDGHKKLAPNVIAKWARNRRLSSFSLGQCTAKQIAHQITAIDLELFEALKIRDLLTVSDRPQPPTLDAITRQRQRFVLWIEVQILSAERAEDRTQRLRFVMKLGRNLESLRNFQSLGAVVTALSAAPIVGLNEMKTKYRHKLSEWKKLYPTLKGKSHRVLQRSDLRKRMMDSPQRRACIPNIEQFVDDLSVIQRHRTRKGRGYRFRALHSGSGITDCFVRFAILLRSMDCIQCLFWYRDGAHRMKTRLVLRDNIESSLRFDLEQMDNITKTQIDKMAAKVMKQTKSAQICSSGQYR